MISHSGDVELKIAFIFCSDGSLFNIWRLKSRTKVSVGVVIDLQYANNAVVPSHTADGLQQNLLMATESYQYAGFMLSTKKTEILP